LGTLPFKSDFRLSRNLLKGQVGDEINVLMAGLCLEFEKMAGDSHYFFCFGKNWVYFCKIPRDLCINRNNHHKPTFHPLGDFLNPALALLGQGLKKSPIGQKLDFANHSYLCKGLT
jgi:hypothetical protein